MNYNESISRLKKLILELDKEEKFISIENEKIENEIREIKKLSQEKISKILEQKKKKLKSKELKITELKNEKMKIIGSIFIMFNQGSISKEELDLVGNISNNISSQAEI